MRTKFTRASQKDKTLVTVNLAQFGTPAYWDGFNLDDNVLVQIEGEEVIFRVNRVRDGRAITAVTHCYPRFLRLPRVGRPVYAETDGIR